MDRVGSKIARRLSLAAVLLLAPLAVVVTPAQARARHRTCAWAHSSTVLQDDFIRVFRTPLRTEKGVGLAGTHYDSVYACWKASGKKTRMVMETPDGYGTVQLDAVKQPDYSGSPIIAFTITSSTRSGNADSIASMNVKVGKILHRNAGDVDAYQRQAMELSIQEFLVTPAGSLAWIGQGNCPESLSGENSITGVYVIDAGRHERPQRCGTPGGDAGASNGPAEFAGLRYETGNAQLSWLSRAGLETSSLR